MRTTDSAAIVAALEAGITLFDTARAYDGNEAFLDTLQFRGTRRPQCLGIANRICRMSVARTRTKTTTTVV